MLSCTNLASSEIRRRLRSHFGVTLPRFDLMAQLFREPDGLRLGELSKRMMVTNGNVTGLIERLSREALIRRETADGDMRVCVVKLTPAGRAVFADMAAAHERWVAELFAGIRRHEIDVLMAGLAVVKQSIAGHRDIPAETQAGRK